MMIWMRIVFLIWIQDFSDNTACRHFHGHCSQEIRETIPVPLRRVRTTRSSIHSHPFQVSLSNPRNLSRKSSFIPRTCNLWNVLPSSCFLESYNLPSCKSKINELDLISLPLAVRFLPSSFVGALYRPPWPFINIHCKKNKKVQFCDYRISCIKFIVSITIIYQSSP